MIKIAPSILSADFAILGAEVDSVMKAGADYIHFDVMDGVFVPNISIGIPVLKSLRAATQGIIDVHLMIEKPVRYVGKFCETGADLVTVHLESDTPENIHAALDEIIACGKVPGISLKPATPSQAVAPFIDKLGLILVMTVEPGFGGQSFMADMLPKTAELRRMIDERGLKCELSVDGGIDDKTAPLALRAGAEVLAAGSYVFRAPDRRAAIEALRNAL